MSWLTAGKANDELRNASWPPIALAGSRVASMGMGVATSRSPVSRIAFARRCKSRLKSDKVS